MTDNDYRRRMDLRLCGIDPDTMKPLVTPFTNYTVAPNAAVPPMPAGHYGTAYVGCGDGDTRVADAGIEREISRLRSEIALRDRALEWVLHNGVFPGVFAKTGEFIYYTNDEYQEVEVPAYLAAIIQGKQHGHGGQKDCQHRATHPGMPTNQPCHYCDGTTTVDGGQS